MEREVNETLRSETPESLRNWLDQYRASRRKQKKNKRRMKDRVLTSVKSIVKRISRKKNRAHTRDAIRTGKFERFFSKKPIKTDNISNWD